MILAALVSVSLVASVAVDSGLTLDGGRMAPLSPPQKRAAAKALVSTTTECIARRVSADPRFSDLMKIGDVNDLIVDSVPSCLEPVRNMIDAYDRMFGQGSGESFFVGPYLDGLPAAVNALVKGSEAKAGQ